MKNPQTPDHESAGRDDRDCTSEAEQPSEYYYDDSTGYERYEGDEDDDEEEDSSDD